jgi:hypothetical protein
MLLTLNLEPPEPCELCRRDERALNSVLCWPCLEMIERLKPKSDEKVIPDKPDSGEQHTSSALARFMRL